MTEGCDRVQASHPPQSLIPPSLPTFSIRASLLPLVPEYCWQDPGFCPSQLHEEGIAEPILLYSLQLVGHWQAGAGGIGARNWCACNGCGPARKRLKAYHATPRYLPSASLSHNQERRAP